MAAEHGQSHRGRGQEDGCRHLETVGAEVAASDWSEMWYLSSDWSEMWRPLNQGCELIFNVKNLVNLNVSCLKVFLLSLIFIVLIIL